MSDQSSDARPVRRIGSADRPSSGAPKSPPAGREPGGRAPAEPPGEDAESTVKAAVVIAIAVLIGAIFLFRGFDEEDGLVAAGSTTTTTTTTSAGASESTTTTVDRDAPPTVTTPEESTTPTSPDATTVAPADLPVIVANGSGTTGVAGQFADELTTGGYQVVGTANAATTSTSVVYHAADRRPEAVALAELLGLDETAVQEMPSPVPISSQDLSDDDIASAAIVVVIGSDLVS